MPAVISCELSGTHVRPVHEPVRMQTLFVQCGEPTRPGLLEALGAQAPPVVVQSLGSPGGLYHAATSATQGFLDEVEYRSMMARYGL
jgi:hypothetical protein